MVFFKLNHASRRIWPLLNAKKSGFRKCVCVWFFKKVGFALFRLC